MEGMICATDLAVVGFGRWLFLFWFLWLVGYLNYFLGCGGVDGWFFSIAVLVM